MNAEYSSRQRSGPGRVCVLLLLPALILVSAAHAQSRDEEFSESIRRAEDQTGEREGSASVDASAVVRQIIESTNAFRKQEGLKPVTTNGQLEQAARYFADYMARTDRYGHTADGQRPADRARQHDYEYCIVSENIAYQYSSRPVTAAELAQRFVEGWKESPEHRKNMLDADVTETGVAVAQSEETDHYYAVQMFGRPKSQSIKVEVENSTSTEISYKLADRRYPLPPRFVRTHERCRPGELAFELPDSAAEEDRTQTFRIESDANFVVTTAEGGKLTVERQTAGNGPDQPKQQPGQPPTAP